MRPAPKSGAGKRRYRDEYRTQKADLQGNKSGAETNVTIDVPAGDVQIERENARTRGMRPRTTAQR